MSKRDNRRRYNKTPWCRLAEGNRPATASPIDSTGFQYYNQTNKKRAQNTFFFFIIVILS